MHILHIINNCNYGGAGFVILPIIKELRKRGVDFTVAYIMGPEKMKDDYQALGAKTVFLGKRPASIIKKVRDIICDKETPITLIHTHLVQASLIGRAMGLFYNIPVVTTRHYLERSKKYHPLYLLEDYTSRLSNRVIAISNAVYDHLLKTKLVNSEKCSMIYNPIDTEIFTIDSEIPINERHHIVCNARFIDLKGIRYLVDSFSLVAARIPDSMLVLIGRYDDSNDVLEQIRNHQYKNRIVVKGFIKREDIIIELSKARIYVQPSLEEGLGIAALEAMGMKCACIFTKIGGLTELANNEANALLVSPRSSKEIAEKIISLWHDDDRVERMGVNANQYVLKEFNSIKIAEEYYTVYKRYNYRGVQK